MKILYLLLFNFSLSFTAQFTDDSEDLETIPLLATKDQRTQTLNNLPHDIKMLIAEKMDISDIPKLIQTTPELYRFFKTYFNQEYLDFKDATKTKTLSHAQLQSDLDSPYKVIKLLKLLNRLYKCNCDMSSIDHDQIALQSSRFRFSPIFLILGGRSALKDFCSNYNINIVYAPKLKSLLKSIRYDYSLLPIILIITYTITCILLIPYLTSIYIKEQERFSHLPQYSSANFSKYYTNNEISSIYDCEKGYESCLQKYENPNKYEIVGCTDQMAIKLIENLTNYYNPNNSLPANSFFWIDAFEKIDSSNFLRVYSRSYPMSPIVAINFFSVSTINKNCLCMKPITLALSLSTITCGLTLIILLTDKIYIACKKKNKANLNIQEI